MEGEIEDGGLSPQTNIIVVLCPYSDKQEKTFSRETGILGYLQLKPCLL